jgi:hypothetical protein
MILEQLVSTPILGNVECFFHYFSTHLRYNYNRPTLIEFFAPLLEIGLVVENSVCNSCSGGIISTNDVLNLTQDFCTQACNKKTLPYLVLLKLEKVVDLHSFSDYYL